MHNIFVETDAFYFSGFRKMNRKLKRAAFIVVCVDSVVDVFLCRTSSSWTVRWT